MDAPLGPALAHDALGRPGLHAGVLGLLGSFRLEPGLLQAWIGDWQAAWQSLPHAADTRKAWVQAVASQETVRYSAQVMQAAGIKQE